MLNYYEVLGCNTDASYQVLKQAYYKLMLKHHPDKLNLDVEESKDVSLITEAWQTLRDGEKRKLYDNQLTQAKFDSHSLLYCTLTLEELLFNENVNVYSYQCRCGGIYEFPKQEAEMQETSCIIECNECSLKICILNKRH